MFTYLETRTRLTQLFLVQQRDQDALQLIARMSIADR